LLGEGEQAGRTGGRSSRGAKRGGGAGVNRLSVGEEKRDVREGTKDLSPPTRHRREDIGGSPESV